MFYVVQAFCQSVDFTFLGIIVLFHEGGRKGLKQCMYSMAVETALSD